MLGPHSTLTSGQSCPGIQAVLGRLIWLGVMGPTALLLPGDPPPLSLCPPKRPGVAQAVPLV